MPEPVSDAFFFGLRNVGLAGHRIEEGIGDKPCFFTIWLHLFSVLEFWICLQIVILSYAFPRRIFIPNNIDAAMNSIAV